MFVAAGEPVDVARLADSVRALLPGFTCQQASLAVARPIQSSPLFDEATHPFGSIVSARSGTTHANLCDLAAVWD
jgi:hypothetical protein